MFILTAVILFVSATLFIIFGSGKTQKWNEATMKVPVGDNSSLQVKSEMAKY